MDCVTIYSDKQAEVSTGDKKCNTTVYKVWKHVAWTKHGVKLWQYVEQPTERKLFAWHFLSPFKQRETTVNHYHAVAGDSPTENQFTQRVNTQHYFVSLIGMFWGYTPV